MRLLTATDFALRTLMCLAAAPGRQFSTDELAKRLVVSRNHLQKVVQTLADGGFVLTTRGAKGGVRLARPAEEIYVGTVVRHFEGGQALVECFRAGDVDCTLLPHCGLRGMLAGAREIFFRHLDGFTLAQCNVPTLAAPRDT